MESKKILIIDDEEDVITYLSAILETNEYTAYSTRDIKSALELVKEINPDLICLDIMMPMETGISFYTKLRQDNEIKKIPVIIISGAIESEKFDFRSYVPDASIPEPESFMEKPIKVNDYLNKVEELIQ